MGVSTKDEKGGKGITPFTKFSKYSILTETSSGKRVASIPAEHILKCF